MSAPLLLEGGESTYNDNAGVVQESIALTTASQQYWAQRRVRAESHIARFQTNASVAEAEREWKKFCVKGTDFLIRLLSRAIDKLERPLSAYWHRDKRLARDGVRIFKQHASIELLIPFSREPVRFVRVASKTADYSIRVTGIDPANELQLGMPHIAVSWRDGVLFVITPTFHYVTMSTYCMDTTDGTRWSSDLVLPKLFTEVTKEFASELKSVETQFAPLMMAWEQEEQITTQESRLRRLQQSAEKWNLIYLPEPQKLEILSALELFEGGDPAAPRGLLLTGPSGVGKSLLGKTIAETVGCNFQHLTPATLKLDHLGGSGRKVREIWEEARRNQPSILYLDECEGVLGRRGAAETDVISTEIVQAFLAEWDGLDKSNQIWVIGSTNRRDLLDDAILSRFGWEMQIKLPTETDRTNILQQELQDVGVDVSLPVEFGTFTQGMSGRDLQEVAKTARRITHPELPTLDQIRDAVGKVKKARNTPVSPQSKWENLVLNQKTKGRLKLISGLLQNADRWAAEGISVPRTLLLEGDPGVGKTEIARTLANESGLGFHAATTADLKANYLGQSGNRVKQLFEKARSHSPCILFLDELDIVAPDRGFGGDDPLTREIVGQLLQEIDGIEAHTEHVFVVAATNRPTVIDSAMLIRFTERMTIPLPDRESRIRLLSIFLANKKLDFPLDHGAVLLADLSEGKGLSGRDLKNWVVSAEQTALLRAIEGDGPGQYTIMLDDFSSPS